MVHEDRYRRKLRGAFLHKGDLVACELVNMQDFAIEFEAVGM